jgi:hypothetical protein
MKKIINISLFLIVLQIVIGLNNFTVKADKDRQWAPDARVPGYLDDTFTPYLVADQNETVHAFASQWIDDGDRRLAIVYRKWSLSGGWTRPIDIILPPSGDAQILGVFLDSSDWIHIVFMNGERRDAAIYYSSAPAINAELVSAWSTPVMIGGNSNSVSSAAIVEDGQGNLLVIYSGIKDGNGVYFVTSSDAGETWSESLPVFLTFDTTLIPFSLRLVMGQNQQVRATWNIVTSLGVDEMLYFANYSISNAKWDIPINLNNRIDNPDYFGPSFPAMVDNGQEIFIMYNSGNPFSDRPVPPGRPIQLVQKSSDGGITWSNPSGPFLSHVGRSGEHALVLDGSGNPHGLFVQRIENTSDRGEYSIIGGIWHSVYINGNWSNPDRFVTTYSPHDVRAIISQGNVLLVVWREDPGAGKHGVWFSYTMLDTPELPITPLSTVQEVTTSLQNTPTVTSELSISTPLPEDNEFERSSPSRWSTNPVLPLLVGVIPVVLVVLGMLFVNRYLVNQDE